MSSPFGGPSSGQDDTQNYRTSLGYDGAPSESSGYSGTGQTPYSNPGFGSQATSSARLPGQGYGGPADTRYSSEGTIVPDQYRDGDPGNIPFSRDYRFTPEEMRVVKECTRESFYYRSLPFSMLTSGLTFMGIKNGYLSAHPKYGVFPKVFGATVFGFVAGKISYFKECQEKFLRLPDSRVGDAIRRRQAGLTVAPPRSQPPSWNQPLDLGTPKVYEGPYPARKESRFDPQVGQSRSAGEQSSAMNTDDYHNALDIDSEKNSYYDDSSLDERRPNSLDFDLDSKPGVGFLGSQPQSGADQGASYDDLRQKHRDAYLRPQRPQ